MGEYKQHTQHVWEKSETLPFSFYFFFYKILIKFCSYIICNVSLKHFNGTLKSVWVLLFNTALIQGVSFKVRNRFSDASRENRFEYTCSPLRTDRPHPHSNQTLLHTARNSLLNFNSLSSSTTEMPWLVWHHRPIRPNSIGNVFDVEDILKKITQI